MDYDALVAESGREERSPRVRTRFSLLILLILLIGCGGCMNGLTRDGTAEPVSQDQIVRRERGLSFLQLTTSISTWFHVPLVLNGSMC